MSTFTLLESDQDQVLDWCNDNLSPLDGVHRFQWFPFYRLHNQPAFRVSIKYPEDALVFALRWTGAVKV